MHASYMERERHRRNCSEVGPAKEASNEGEYLMIGKVLKRGDQNH